MIELARKFGDGPRSLKSIAEEKDLSAHYLEQLAAPLRNAGLIKSIRGAYGGYILNDKPSAISAGDIIRVLEGPITPVGGIEEEESAQQEIWSRIRDVVKEVLDTTTLKDINEHDDKENQKEYIIYIRLFN